METVERVSEWTGWPLVADQLRLLARLGQWLVAEAIPAGGLGPNEGPRVIDRHLADSLLFAGGWPHPTPPGLVVDLGSGVGLPGLPLAILWPESRFELVDRSLRRVDLARRAVRALGLGNVEVVQAEASSLVEATADLVVARAVADAIEVREWAGRLTAPGGVIVIGGSWVDRPQPVEGEQILEVPSTVLDRPVWLRIMAPP